MHSFLRKMTCNGRSDMRLVACRVNCDLLPAISRLFLISLGLLGLTTSTALAGGNIFTETLNIVPAPCEGLQLAGVTYSFTVAGLPNPDCTAGTFAGPGLTNHIQAPNIEGTAAGVLHLTFDHPTTHFDFGVAESTLRSPQTVVIDLNRPGVGMLRQEVDLTTTRDPLFVGGEFVYDGPAVKTAAISFPVGGGFARFAVDNVSYSRPPGQTNYIRLFVALKLKGQTPSEVGCLSLQILILRDSKAPCGASILGAGACRGSNLTSAHARRAAGSSGWNGCSYRARS
jgi:hypothetical protein